MLKALIIILAIHFFKKYNLQTLSLSDVFHQLPLWVVLFVEAWHPRAVVAVPYVWTLYQYAIEKIKFLPTLSKKREHMDEKK